MTATLTPAPRINDQRRELYRRLYAAMSEQPVFSARQTMNRVYLSRGGERYYWAGGDRWTANRSEAKPLSEDQANHLAEIEGANVEPINRRAER